MTAITEFGDPAVTVSMAALLLIWLLALRLRLVALSWAAALVLTGSATAALKILVYLHAGPYPPFSRSGPSGHVSGSALVYGAFALVVARATLGWARAVAIASAALAVAAIGFSRKYLHTHSTGDVIAGCMIGSINLAWFARRFICQSLPLAGWRAAVVSAVALACVVHGSRLDVDFLLRTIAAQLKTLMVPIG